jgi:hypothetical protein
LKNEKIKISNPTDGETLISSIASIYGIYKLDIHCENDIVQNNFKCKISNSFPRSFNSDLILTNTGIIE